MTGRGSNSALCACSVLRAGFYLLGLTQGELALKCGVRRETIVNLERGKYNPSLKLALKVCAALQARVEDIFWLEG